MREMFGNVLVTGASGFVGKHLCDALLRQGKSVRVSVRSNNYQNKNVDIVNIVDINGSTDWQATLVNIHTVIHLAARVHVMNDKSRDPLGAFRNVNVNGTLNLAEQAANAGAKRFIFLSSVKVNGEFTGSNQLFSEIDTADPKDAYGISKFEAEQGLLLIAQKTGMEVVIIRSPLIYGAGVGANFASMIRAIKSRIPLPLGAIDNKRSFVYIGNLVSLMMRCIDHPKAANQVFMVSDGSDLSTTELLYLCADALGMKVRLLPIPKKIIELGALMLDKRDVVQRLCGNLQVNITKSHTLLGWSPPVSVADGLKATMIGLR